MRGAQSVLRRAPWGGEFADGATPLSRRPARIWCELLAGRCARAPGRRCPHRPGLTRGRRVPPVEQVVGKEGQALCCVARNAARLEGLVSVLVRHREGETPAHATGIASATDADAAALAELSSVSRAARPAGRAAARQAAGWRQWDCTLPAAAEVHVAVPLSPRLLLYVPYFHPPFPSIHTPTSPSTTCCRTLRSTLCRCPQLARRPMCALRALCWRCWACRMSRSSQR